MDGLFRQTVCRILHLPHYTPWGISMRSAARGGLGLKCMDTYVPYLAVGRIDHVRWDECLAIAELANESYLSSVQRRYVAMLHPIQVDRQMIADHWRQCWLGSMAGNGLVYEPR